MSKNMNRVAFISAAFSLSLCMAVPLPEERAPFARGTLARRPVEMRVARCFWRGNEKFTSKRTFNGVSFVCGDKRAVVAGIDNLDVNNPILFGRIPIYRNATRLGTVCLNTRWNYIPIDGNDRLDIDEAKGTATWSRRYGLPDGRTNVVSYAVSGGPDGRIAVDWDLGIDIESAKAYPHGLPWIVSYCPAGTDMPTPKNCTFETGGEAAGDYLAVTFPKDWFWISKWYPGNRPGSHHYRFLKAGNFTGGGAPKATRGRIVIDFGRTAELLEKPIPPYDGVDFWGANAWDVPRPPTRNLMVNGSFEQKWKGWRWFWGGNWYEYAPPGKERFGIVDGGLFGGKALVVRATQPHVASIISASVPTIDGQKYTISWYARSTGGKDVWHYVKVASAGMGGKFDRLARPKYKKAGGEWRRFSFTIDADGAGIYLIVDSGPGELLVDGIQIEKGAEATEYVEDPVVGTLFTANADNDIRLGEPIGARLAMQVKKGVSGQVRVCVKNYYSEILFDKTFPVADGETPLDLDPAALGTGVFVVSMHYAVKDAAREYAYSDYQRFCVSQPLENTHPTAKFFSGQAWFTRVERGADVARKMKEWGIGSVGWSSVGNSQYASNTNTAPLFRENRIAGILHPVSYCYPNGHKLYLGLRATNITDALVKEWEDRAYESAKACAPDDDLWTAFNEEESWVRAHIGAENHFKLVQACYRGCRRAFDERGLKLRFAPTHGCSHYFRGKNQDIIDTYLETADRHGFKYDAVAIHSYANIDGSILGPHDADVETDHLIERMRHYGYDDKTPILFSECYNMMPMYIPEWGVIDWFDGRHCGMPSQDLGQREFLHAAAMARLWITALKHWPRLCYVNTWQFMIPFLDHNLTPPMWLKMVNTLGHLFPDPRFCGEAQPFANVRAKAFRSRGKAVMAVWTTDNDVERGIKKGPRLSMRLPADVRFVDLMGNVRTAVADSAGETVVPLTAAPLFLVSSNAEALLKAVEEAGTDDASVALRADIRPAADGSVELSLENLVKSPQETQFGNLPGRGTLTARIVPPQTVRPMEMYSFTTNFPFLANRWRLDWFYVPKCGAKPDWTNIPAVPITNEVRFAKDAPVTMKANFRAAWNKEKFFLRVEVEDDVVLGENDYKSFDPKHLYRCDGCLEVYFDGFADGRITNRSVFDQNDMRYDFVYGRVWRQQAVNWQLAQGTASATDEEIRQKLEQRVVKTEKGYAYEIAIAARYMAPVELKAGTRASLGLYIHDRDDHSRDRRSFALGPNENGLSLATEPGKVCNNNPFLWPEFILMP
jgi:hypothetical protein